MKVSKYLRLALMFGDNNAQTFRRNLAKMVELVLFDNDNQEMTALEIINGLKDNYSLEFSDTEVLEAIKNQNKLRIVSLNRDNSFDKVYKLTPKAKDDIEKKVNDDFIDNIIGKFLKTRNDVELTINEFKQMIYDYFYFLFNSNAAILQEFLGHDYSLIDLSCNKLTDTEFSEENKKYINEFLYWDNGQKDKCVYNMVSCCFDYCMMNVHQDKKIYENIFNQKVFYLDTNVIFRLMGLNQESRRKILDAFITKCVSVGIKLKVTNHTIKEIDNTIEYNVNEIKSVLNGNKPIRSSIFAFYSHGFINQSFYVEYEKWCDDKTNKVGDYHAFCSFLKRKARKIIMQFEREDFAAYDGGESFVELFDSLSQYKADHHRNTNRASISADVNNYLHVLRKNKERNASDFFNTHFYFISTDHVFGDWTRERRPAAIPIVVLPSVWYSIILEYAGRSDGDDYASFTRFLNFSLSNTDGQRDEIKIEILKKVLALDDNESIKTEILLDIEEKLSENTESIDSIDDVVETTHRLITDLAVEKAREEERSKSNDEKVQIQDEYEKSIKRIKLENQKNTDTEVNKIIDYEVEKRAKALRKKYISIFLLIIFLEIAGIVLWTGYVCKMNTVNWDKTAFIADRLEYLFGSISLICDIIIIPVVFCGFSLEKIKNRIRSKVETEYRNIA